MIRDERPGDEEAIAAVVEAAFARAREARLVDDLRRDGAAVLSLVAEEAGAVVGHVMLCRATLAGSPVVALVPLAVAPAHQGRGLGSALTGAAVERADAGGEPLVLLVGAPSYYSRFGFRPARELGIEPPWPHVGDAYQVLRLTAYDPALRGVPVYPPAFADP